VNLLEANSPWGKTGVIRFDTEAKGNLEMAYWAYFPLGVKINAAASWKQHFSHILDAKNDLVCITFVP